MPELPEVEMIVKDLRSKIVGRRILGVQTDWPKYFRLPSSEAGFRACITQQSHYGVDRRSKNVLISLR
jgi:formamidopyrimidine-DNA glycosylase